RLDVADAFKIVLEVDPLVAERALRLGAGLLPHALQLRRAADAAHAATAAAGARFEHHRVADGLRHAQRLRGGTERTFRAGNDGHANVAQRLSRFRLVVKALEDLRRRTDEDESVFFTDLGEIEVLRQETVARMDRLRP